MFLRRKIAGALGALQLSLTPCAANIIGALRPQLSAQAWITTNNATAVRWSDYNAPIAEYYVHVAEEEDVATTVSLASRYSLSVCF